ncbi:MAG: hypothetical protein AAF799_30015 [Myxococcota bacterium]
MLGRAGEVATDTAPIAWRSDGITSRGDDLLFQVPEDLTGLLVVVESSTAQTAVGWARQDHRMLIDLGADEWGETPPFFHTYNPVGSIAFPTHESSALEPGCLEIRATADGDLGGREGTMHFVSRRSDPGETLTMALVASGSTSLYGFGLDQVAQDITTVLAEAGITADIQTDTLAQGAPFVSAEGEDADALRASYAPAETQRVPVFLIQAFSDEPDTLGIAAGLPGPVGVPGTVASGVLVAVDAHLDGNGALRPSWLAETVAHEFGHQIGLAHTSEAEGDFHDPLEDTPQCTTAMDANGDGTLDPEECPDGTNLMFWVAAESFPQRDLSPWQGRLLGLSAAAR